MFKTLNTHTAERIKLESAYNLEVLKKYPYFENIDFEIEIFPSSLELETKYGKYIFQFDVSNNVKVHWPVIKLLDKSLCATHEANKEHEAVKKVVDGTIAWMKAQT